MSESPQTLSPPLEFAPMRVGEHAALDFLNSVFAPSGAPLDFLHDGDTMLRWLSASAVLPADYVAAVRSLTARQRDLLAAETRQLREWFRVLVVRWAGGGPRRVRPADLERVNDLLARSPLVEMVVRSDAALSLRAERHPVDAQAVLAALASCCADLLAHCRHDQVRKCENPACTMMFADTKRGPRRRWCSMAVCGNRMKVAAHRSRLKA
jgi:predicted RNA-binding Zn ribbon-like protein